MNERVQFKEVVGMKHSGPLYRNINVDGGMWFGEWIVGSHEAGEGIFYELKPDLKYNII